MAKVKIRKEQLDVAVGIMRALAHPLRMKILEYVDKNKAINVNKIYNSLKLEQSITSQHLRILRGTGIVETNRDGKFIHYQINYDNLCRIMEVLHNYTNDKDK